MIEFHQNTVFETIPFDQVHPVEKRQNNQQKKNIDDIENKLTRFQINPEIELACNYKTPLYKT